MNANPETQHKVLILGNQEVGKTAIVNSVSFTKTSGLSGENASRLPDRDTVNCPAATGTV